MDPGIWIGVVVGSIGAVSAAIGAAAVAHHRTRGARRDLAADATERAMKLLDQHGEKIEDPVRLQAELFLFYYKTIIAAENSPGPELLRMSSRQVIKHYYPSGLPKSGNEQPESGNSV